MVRLYKELFGRGPTKARSYFAGPDVLVCILRETFTPAERSLVAMGEKQRVRDARVFAVDGSAYFSRPGPRLVDSLEIVAHALNPDVHPRPPAGAARRLTAPELA